MGGKATYFGVEVGGVGDSDSDGLISDSHNYEGGINQIGPPNERGHRIAASTEGERAILRPEFGGLMRIARIARPGASYDTSATTQSSFESKLAISKKVKFLTESKRKKSHRK